MEKLKALFAKVVAFIKGLFKKEEAVEVPVDPVVPEVVAPAVVEPAAADPVVVADPVSKAE